ncbi:MAG: two-component system response regulator FixJ [Paraglaciecola sp.]|jgi:two-component system response regulator FixJ
MLRANYAPTRQAIIYLVDHDKHSLASLSSLLTPLNATIKCFTSAESFLEQKICKNAACLLLEAHLQEVSESGIELLENMVRQSQLIPTIILASSSDADSEIPTAVRAIKASALDFIEKPYVEHLAFMKVKTILQQYFNNTTTLLHQSFSSSSEL